MRHIFALCLLLAACGTTEKEPQRDEAPDWVRGLYDFWSSRLMAEFLEDGQVVSRMPDGSPEHRGDAFKWTTFAIGVLPCHDARVLLDRMTRRIRDLDGEFLRFDPFDPSYSKDRMSFDGETSAYFGIARYLDRCKPEDTTELAAAWAERLSYVSIHGDHTVPEFTFTRDALGHRLGLKGEPHWSRLPQLEAQLWGWVEAVAEGRRFALSDLGHQVGAKSPACFRVNLVWEHVRALEAMGIEIHTEAKDRICREAGFLKLPHFQHWCGDRRALEEWAAVFHPDTSEFYFQRCPDWESDEPNGRRYPALDFITALVELYNL